MEMSYITPLAKKRPMPPFSLPMRKGDRKRELGLGLSQLEICVAFPHKIDMDSLGSSHFHVICYREAKMMGEFGIL